MGGRVAEIVVEFLMKPLNTVEDTAKTQTFLAASTYIRENDAHGQYWSPEWSWTQRYVECHQEELTDLGQDRTSRGSCGS